MRYTLEVGGQTIDRFDNMYRRMFNALTEKNPTNDGQILSQKLEDAGTFNLPFWFCRNPGLALPLIALQYHEVKLILELNDASNLQIQRYKTVKQVTDIELWVDYVYLDTDERRRFAQVSHEYLIEQVQVNKFSFTNSGNNANENLELNFNHPVKELCWVYTDDNNIPTWHNFMVNDTSVPSGTTTSVQLTLNGQDRFAKRVARYFKELQVYDYHSGYGSLVTGDFDVDMSIDGNQFVSGSVGTMTAASSAVNALFSENVVLTRPVYVYSFALKPEEHQPSGTCNFSRIDSANLVLEGLGTVQTFGASNKAVATGNGYVTGAGTKGVQSLFIPPDVKRCNVYAVNYNVLRIMSGMGGLAYSN